MKGRFRFRFLENGSGGSGSTFGFGKHVRLARLQNKVGTKYFFSRHEFSHEKCSEIFLEIFEPLLCGSEKIPQNSRQISLPKIKKKTPTSFCRSAGRKTTVPTVRFPVPVSVSWATLKISGAARKASQRVSQLPCPCRWWCWVCCRVCLRRPLGRKHYYRYSLLLVLLSII